MSSYFDLGSYNRAITTAVAEARSWFNRGLIWCYGFNQEEAVRCFEKVIELDPEMCYGLLGRMAYASGPFYNKPWEWYGEQERHQITALCHKYASMAVEAEATRHLRSNAH